MRETHPLANALLAQGRAADAVTQLEPFVRDHPQHAEALVTVGVALTESGRPADGLVYLERAAGTGSPTARLDLGLAPPSRPSADGRGGGVSASSG